MSQTELTPLLEEFEAEDRELARQLFNLRRPPGDALERRIQAIPYRQAGPRLWLPRLAWASMALLVMALLFISPPARAMLGQFEQVVGRVHLLVMDVLPTPTASIIIESTPVSLAEARALVPFDVILPGYRPARLTAAEQIFVTRLEPPVVKILWRDVEGGFVQLTARLYDPDRNPIETRVGPESSQTVLINGQEAVVLYGAWDEASRTWSHQDQVITLIWQAGTVQYELLSFSDVVSLPELMAMAESVR